MADAIYYPTTDDCTPTGLRYKPIEVYMLPYKPETFACCDYVSGKMAFAFEDRDYGVIELGRLHPGVDFRGDKRFYIDFKMWKDRDGGPIRALDMAFGYDYQRLYTLYKQRRNNGTYRLWLTRYETGNYKDGNMVQPPISVPLYTLVHGANTPSNPAIPGATYDQYQWNDVYCSVMDYLETYGITGVCLDHPSLEQFFSCVVSNDKVFVTMPAMFKPYKAEIPDGATWTPDSPRVIYQLLLMLDETTSKLEACRVVGAVSWWHEDKDTPWPEITPHMPLKAHTTQLDDCLVWRCVHERTFSPTLTEEAWYDNPSIDYDPNTWEDALDDRFWQPYQTEYIKIPDLIADLTHTKSTVLAPLRCSVARAYAWTPVVTDLYKKSLVDWAGRRVYGIRGKELIEYSIVYHNYKRKIIRGLKVVPSGSGYKTEFDLEDHHTGEFLYQCTGHFRTPSRLAPIPPAVPPTPANIASPSFGAIPQCAPIPPVPLAVPPPITVGPPPPPVTTLNIVFVLDVTGSMANPLLVMASSLSSMASQLSTKGYTDVRYFCMSYHDSDYNVYSPSADANNAGGPYQMSTDVQIKRSIESLVGEFGGKGSDEAGATAVLRAHDTFQPEFYPSNGGEVNTQYVLITDESNDAGSEGIDKAAAISMCQSTHAAMTWIVPKGWTDISGTLISETANSTGGSVLTVMDSGSGWGTTAADLLVEAIDDAVHQRDPESKKVDKWLEEVPEIPDTPTPTLPPPLDVSIPDNNASLPLQGLTLPGFKAYHIFAIENLSCNTWMTGVTLECTEPTMKIGEATPYGKEESAPIPDQTTMYWDEIPPGHEVRFSVYSDEFDGVSLEGMDLEYELEIR